MTDTFIYSFISLVRMSDFDFAPIDEVVNSLLLGYAMTGDECMELVGNEISLDDLRFIVTRKILVADLYCVTNGLDEPKSKATALKIERTISGYANTLMCKHYGITQEEYKGRIADIVTKLASNLPDDFHTGIDYDVP